MHEFGLTAEGKMTLKNSQVTNTLFAEAIDRISAVRSAIQPTEFFMAQLEMYECMNCEVDPAKYPEYRRFLYVGYLLHFLPAA
jgi:hypothetical protein